MSLREAIADLRGAAKRLNSATFKPDMNALQKFVETLEAGNVSATPPTDVRQRALEKFLRGDNDFTRRERRALPFIIYEGAINLDGVKKILRLLDFDNTRHISGLVNVYLTGYDASAKTDLLRLLLNYGRLADNSRRLQKIFSMRKFLFGDNCLANTAKLLAQRQSVNVVLEDLGLTNFFKVSNFIHAALKNFYRTSYRAAQIKILRELDADPASYKNIFPAAADALIPVVGDAGKKICLVIFYRQLGDPRFGFTRFNWNAVSDNAKKFFLRWLAEDDFKIFFKVTRETLQGDVNALNMWNAREEFWSEYLPRIGNTWVVLGSNAQRIARRRLQDQRKHGKLLGSADSDKSGFLFQIGQYIFVEWSHDGALRVYPAQRVSNYIGNDFAKSEMMNVKITYRKPHLGAWQDNVSDWIARYC